MKKFKIKLIFKIEDLEQEFRRKITAIKKIKETLKLDVLPSPALEPNRKTLVYLTSVIIGIQGHFVLRTICHVCLINRGFLA